MDLSKNCYKRVCLLPERTQRHPIPTRAGRGPAGFAETCPGRQLSSAPQQASPSAPNAPCSFSLPLPWALALHGAPQPLRSLCPCLKGFSCAAACQRHQRSHPGWQQKCWGHRGRVLSRWRAGCCLRPPSSAKCFLTAGLSPAADCLSAPHAQSHVHRVSANKSSLQGEFCCPGAYPMLSWAMPRR